MNIETRSWRQSSALASKGYASATVHNTVLGVLRSIQPNGSLLDFGAGVGTFAKELLRTFNLTKLVGADLMPRPDELPESIEWIQSDLNDSLLLPDASFDVITTVEVIEHLENPRAVFRELQRLLRPDGILVLSTPNQESLRSYITLIVNGHFASFRNRNYPAHITALLREDFVRICRETGFASPNFRYTNFGRIPMMTRHSWQQVSWGQLNGRLFSDNLVVCTKSISQV
jgi:2-polyprenyl-3-methyl-5-hydroxy-6-metoxy-1,4-benzoquinol methylase